MAKYMKLTEEQRDQLTEWVIQFRGTTRATKRIVHAFEAKFGVRIPESTVRYWFSTIQDTQYQIKISAESLMILRKLVASGQFGSMDDAINMGIRMLGASKERLFRIIDFVNSKDEPRENTTTVLQIQKQARK